MFPAGPRPFEANVATTSIRVVVLLHRDGLQQANHETLTQALMILNLGAVLKTVRELATTLLDGLYGELKLVIVRHVQGKKCTLATDA